MDGCPNPDFLSNFLALANFMRLSFIESRTREHSWSRVQEIRVTPAFSTQVR
jgi:hypothetical protein